MVERLTVQNYQRLISPAKINKIEAIAAQLHRKKENRQLKTLSIEGMVDKLIWRTAMMHVLESQGGILIDEDLLLT